MTQRPRDRVPSGSILALPDPRRPDRANPPTNIWWPLFLTALAWFTCTGFPLHSQEGILCWGFKGVQEEIPREEARKRHFYRDNAPVHNPILVTDYLTKMGIKTADHPPYSPDIAPCDFWIFPKLRGCRYETIKEMKEAVRKVIDTLTQEDFHGALKKLLERYNKRIAAGGVCFEGDQGFMCVLSIEVPIRKKSLEIYLMILGYTQHPHNGKNSTKVQFLNGVKLLPECSFSLPKHDRIIVLIYSKLVWFDFMAHQP